MKQKIYSYTFIIFSIGFIVGIYALFHNGLGNFNIIPEIKDEAILATHGVYKYIRHPMYFSVTFMMLGVIIYNLNIFNITIFSLLILVLFLKARKEELLWGQKSQAYLAYMQKTKMIIPYIF